MYSRSSASVETGSTAKKDAFPNGVALDEEKTNDVSPPTPERAAAAARRAGDRESKRDGERRAASFVVPKTSVTSISGRADGFPPMTLRRSVELLLLSRGGTRNAASLNIGSLALEGDGSGGGGGGRETDKDGGGG